MSGTTLGHELPFLAFLLFLRRLSNALKLAATLIIGCEEAGGQIPHPVKSAYRNVAFLSSVSLALDWTGKAEIAVLIAVPAELASDFLIKAI
jgi:hypothetical protein